MTNFLTKIIPSGEDSDVVSSILQLRRIQRTDGSCAIDSRRLVAKRASVTVESLLFEGDRVTGVKTADGEEIRADKVVSNIGARETVDRLLPQGHGDGAWVEKIRSFGPNICHFSLFLGFAGGIEAAGATKANHWLYPTGETDAVWTDAPAGLPPAMFVSFASLKDPDHDPGPECKHAGEIVAWADWSTVQRWAELPPGDRGDDFIDFKSRVEVVLFDQFKTYFPRVAELVVFRELATPLATASITGHRKGSFYGLDVTPKRVLSDALRMKTPIKGLYLTGQDVLSPGYSRRIVGRPALCRQHRPESVHAFWWIEAGSVRQPNAFGRDSNSPWLHRPPAYVTDTYSRRSYRHHIHRSVQPNLEIECFPRKRIRRPCGRRKNDLCQPSPVSVGKRSASQTVDPRVGNLGSTRLGRPGISAEGRWSIGRTFGAREGSGRSNQRRVIDGSLGPHRHPCASRNSAASGGTRQEPL